MISLSSNIRAFWMPWSLRSDSTNPTASLIDSNWLYAGLPSAVWNITMCCDIFLDTSLGSAPSSGSNEVYGSTEGTGTA